MSIFSTPEEHADNTPDTWVVTKAAPNRWHLCTKSGGVMDSATTKKGAEELRTEGLIADLYAKETRWYAGESIPGWRDYAELVSES